MQIGSWFFPNRVFVAPMAGVTDRPFRKLCKRLGAGHAVSEMAASNPQLWASVKTARRLNHDGEIDPITVQLAGGDPIMMAQAAVFNIEKGARIIDINMGCPVKKVCQVAAGSALLKHEDLVQRILESVVNACAPYNVPVTLKTRTGWDHASKNAVRIGQMAEQAGIAALTLHGRTRADLYTGHAEYDTIREVKASINIPVVANGDIDSPEKAREVLAYTGADAIMIGRAALGRPWIFREINHFLTTGQHLPSPDLLEFKNDLLEHLEEHYAFYGEQTGVRTARKHIGWYLSALPDTESLRQELNAIESSAKQFQAIMTALDARMTKIEDLAA